MIISQHEYFRSDYFKQINKISPVYRILLTYYRDYFPILFINNYVYKRRPGIIGAVGFEALYTNEKKWQTKNMWRYLKNIDGLKIIHLKRKNLLRVYLSLLTANKLRLWVSTNNKSPVLKSTTIDHLELKNFFAEVTKLQEYYQKYFSNKEMIDVYYENIVTNKDGEMNKILDFLEVPKRNLTSKLVKLNTRLLQDCISNYSSLKKYFAGTQWSGFFNNKQY